MSEKQVRVRIAPSPTGFPHVGTAYIGLFNYCFARSKKGRFILRIEDTDQARSSRESEEAILESLKWLGLDWDEGPDCGGEKGPYRQSERLDIYSKYAEELVQKGAAYYCFCLSERLAELRKTQMKEKKRLGYDGKCREIPAEEALQRIKNGEKAVLRLKVPKDRESIVFFDTIRGKEISRPIEEVDDQVLIKADGFPTYHMANVVDDHLMEITHVIRGEEWINSTPKHVLLYEAFGWKMPVFAHLSLLRNADKNKSKVSKRKNPVSLTWFRAAGYTREAVLNFLGLMAYHFKGDDEVFSVREMVENFSFENFSTSSPVFDLVKLGDLNARYIRSMDDESFVSYCSGRAKYALSYLKPLLPMIRQRTNAEIPYNTWTDMFFRVSLDYDAGALVPKGIDKGGVLKMLKDMKKKLSKSEAASAADFESLAGQYKEETGIKTKPFMMALRVALTGSAASLPLWESLEIMGKDAAARRLGEAADFLASAR